MGNVTIMCINLHCVILITLCMTNLLYEIGTVFLITPTSALMNTLGGPLIGALIPKAGNCNFFHKSLSHNVLTTKLEIQFLITQLTGLLRMDRVAQNRQNYCVM